MARHGPRVAALLPALAVVIFISGCSSEQENSSDRPSPVIRRATHGPVSLTMTVTDPEIDFPGGTRVIVNASAPADYSLSIDDYQSLLQENGVGFELRVAGSQVTKSEPSPDGTVTWRSSYDLEYVLPGKYEIPGAALSFYSESSSGDDGQRTVTPLTTEPVTVVAHDVSQRQLTEEELAAIKTLDPIELPGVWSRWWWLAPVIGVIVLVAAIMILPRLLRRWRRARVERQQMVVIPPHEWASREFAALVRARLLEQGLPHEYHYRISYIMRGYIERRFGFRAGEMTSEEFLNAAVADARLAEDLKTELHRFIATTDRVKYARHEPTENESGAALRAAESFVERTTGGAATATMNTTNPPPTRERAA